MTTIIIAKNKNGVITGRCDASCYNAKSKKCTCVCGGDNHGRGINSAILYTSRHKKYFETIYYSSKIVIKQGQLQLFEEELL